MMRLKGSYVVKYCVVGEFEINFLLSPVTFMPKKVAAPKYHCPSLI